MKTTASNLGERAKATTDFGKYKPVNLPVKTVSEVEKGTRPKSCPTCKGSR